MFWASWTETVRGGRTKGSKQLRISPDMLMGEGGVDVQKVGVKAEKGEGVTRTRRKERKRREKEKRRRGDRGPLSLFRAQRREKEEEPGGSEPAGCQQLSLVTIGP